MDKLNYVTKLTSNSKKNKENELNQYNVDTKIGKRKKNLDQLQI